MGHAVDFSFKCQGAVQQDFTGRKNPRFLELPGVFAQKKTVVWAGFWRALAQ